MGNWNLDVMYILRKYLWDRISSENILDIDDYYSDNIGEHIVPIIPVQQSPDMNQFLSGKTHIVYDKVGMSYENNWLICCEQILFTIYSIDYSEINTIRNFMTDEFRRMDDTAKEMNAWGLEEFVNNNYEGPDKFKMHSVFIVDISPTEPSKELQGYLASDVILEVKYSRITDGNGRFV